MKPLWTAEKNSHYQSRANKIAGATLGFVIRYNPPDRVEDGKTFMSCNFPAMAMTAWVSDADKIAAQIAHQLNTYPALLDALKRVESLMTELGAKGEPLKTVRAAIAAAEAEPEAVS